MSGQRVVHVGRGRGPWGNRFSSRPSSVPGVVMVEDAAEAVRRHRYWLAKEVLEGRVSLEDLAGLHGARLECFCPDGERHCHARTLELAAAIAEGILVDRERKGVVVPSAESLELMREEARAGDREVEQHVAEAETWVEGERIQFSRELVPAGGVKI